MRASDIAAYRDFIGPEPRCRDAARDLADLLAGPPGSGPPGSGPQGSGPAVSGPADHGGPGVHRTHRTRLPASVRVPTRDLLRLIASTARTTDADGLHTEVRPTDAGIADAIASWRAALAAHIAHSRPGTAADAITTADLDIRARRLLDAILTTTNLATLEHDFDTLAPARGFERLGMEQRRREVARMVDKLAARCSVPRDRLRRMIELRYDTQTERITVRAIFNLYRSTWNMFGVGEDRRGLAKLTAVILVNRLMHNASPLLWTKIFDGRSFNAEYMLVLGGLELVDAHTSKYETELSTGLLFVIRQRIHALAAKALFVRDLGLSDQYGSGELFDIIWKGEDAYNNIVKSLLMDGVPTLLTIPIVLGGLTILHPLLGALGLLSIPAVYWLARRTGPQMQLAREEGMEKKRALFTRGNTMIEGIETLLAQGHLAGGRKSFLELEREGDTIDRDMISRWASIHLWQRYPVILTGIITALVGAWLVKQGAISPGGVITTVDYAGRLRTTVVDLIHRYYEDFPRDINNAHGLQRLIDWATIASGDETAKRPASALPSTRIQCHALAYKDIVRGLDIHADPGEFVTISGTSGIGKTTLLRLIAGLYRPSAGVVTIGGVPLQDIRAEGPDSLYTLLSISSQQPYIFDDMTLRQNLELFSPEPASDARIAEILRSVGLGKLVPDLDKPGKRRLSGGERVRFGLARALLKLAPGRPMIVLLDEPTSALADDDGPGSTRAIRELLLATHRANPLLTIICVTHDKQLIAAADRDISLSPAQVAYFPEPPPAAEKEYVALPGIVVDFGKA